MITTTQPVTRDDSAGAVTSGRIGVGVGAGAGAAAVWTVRVAVDFAAVAGAQLIARSRSDITLYDVLIGSYRAAGLLPA